MRPSARDRAAAARRRRCCAASRPRGTAAGLDDRVLVGHLLQRVGVGRRAGLRLLHRREAELLEQDRAQLRRGVHVELLARVRVDLALRAVALRRRAPCRSSSRNSTVDADAGVFHLREHAHQRQLEPLVELDELARVERLARARRRAASTTAARRPVSLDRRRRRRGRACPRLGVGRRSSSDEVPQREVLERGTSPRPGSSRYAITAVSWCERRGRRRASPCISSLARCATSGGPVGADERVERVAHRRRREQLARRRT